MKVNSLFSKTHPVLLGLVICALFIASFTVVIWALQSGDAEATLGRVEPTIDIPEGNALKSASLSPRVDWIVREAALIKEPSDLRRSLDSLNSLFEKEGNSSHFLQAEELVVNELVARLSGDHRQIQGFMEVCYMRSTANLLAIRIFESGKLSLSKQNVLFMARIFRYYFCYRGGHCQDYTSSRAGEFLLRKVTELRDKLSTYELLTLFADLNIEISKQASFLDAYRLSAHTEG